MDNQGSLPLKYQPLDPQRLTYAILSAFTHARQSVRIWGVRAAWNVWAGTVQSLLRNRFNRLVRQPGPADVTILVISIYPDLLKIWYHFVTCFVDMQRTRMVIVDSCGRIDPKAFPLARVVRFCNFSHARKIDYFIHYEIDTPYVWLCDDDSLVVSKDALDLARSKFADEKNTAVVSLQQRGWSFEINGQPRRAMGVYNILFARDVFIKENLSFSPIRSKNTGVGRGSGYYDTGDYANEQLLLRGYRVETMDSDESSVRSFVGASSGMLKALSLQQAAAELENEIKLNPKVASYHLVGLFCDWKIVQLYRQIFSSEPQWLPPLSEQELRQLAGSLQADFSEKALRLFENYQAKYQDLSRLAGNLT